MWQIFGYTNSKRSMGGVYGVLGAEGPEVMVVTSQQDGAVNLAEQWPAIVEGPVALIFTVQCLRVFASDTRHKNRIRLQIHDVLSVDTLRTWNQWLVYPHIDAPRAAWASADLVPPPCWKKEEISGLEVRHKPLVHTQVGLRVDVVPLVRVCLGCTEVGTTFSGRLVESQL
jgi:hypothetical protein